MAQWVTNGYHTHWSLLMTSSVHKVNSDQTLPPHYQLNNSTWWLVPACQCCQTQKKKTLMALFSICRFQTARSTSVFLFPPCFSSAAVSLCLTIFNVSALTCVLLLFLLCRDLFHSLQASITAHGSARRNYLFIELVDGQEAPNRCIMQHVRMAMSKGFVLKQ